ncbi:MAG: hypothetical protein WC812_00840 [Candidatus Pacearchaeota archaeon]|jgi:hypothetical protein
MLERDLKRFNQILKEEEEKPEEQKGPYFSPEYNAKIRLIIEDISRQFDKRIYIPNNS